MVWNCWKVCRRKRRKNDVFHVKPAENGNFSGNFRLAADGKDMIKIIYFQAERLSSRTAGGALRPWPGAAADASGSLRRPRTPQPLP